jgi:hypothetical protein
MAAGHKGLGDTRRQALDDICGLDDGGKALAHEHELVAAEPGQGVAGTHDG